VVDYQKVTIPKSILATLLFVVVLEVSGLWLLLDFDFYFIVYKGRLVTALIELTLVILFVLWLGGVKRLKPTPTNWKFYLIALIVGAAYPFFQEGLNFLYYLQFNPEPQDKFAFDWTNTNKAYFLASVFCFPVAEEFFFRGYIQDGLQRTHKPITALTVTTLLFAAIHLPYIEFFIGNDGLSPHRAYIALFGGLISGVLYYKSKSIGPSIVMHVAWNLVANLS